MELEFDKEMDAILRKARGGSGVSVTTAHLDADTIATFVENALPDAARSVSIGHFADCDSCRKQLSQTISLNETAASTADVGAADLVGVAATEPSWISRLFRTPNLAFAMGALVLGFSGVIGYLALQSGGSANDTVSQVANKSMPSAATAPQSTANVTPDSTASGTATTNSTVIPGVISTPPVIVSESKPAKPANESRAETGEMTGGVPADTIAPAQPATVAPPATTRDEKAEVSTDGSTAAIAKRKDQDKEVASIKSDNYDDRGRNGSPKLAAKKPETGPSRQSGNVQSQQNNMIYETRVPTRSVGGRTFENRNGVWTDSAYRNQATTVYRRNLNEYKKLDGGIRSIADKLGGTVIIMSGQRAYRIQ